MVPTLFHIGGVAIGTHDFFIVLGVVAAAALFAHEARRQQLSSDALWWVVGGALVTGAVFAKASVIWRYVGASPHRSFVDLWLYGGKSVLGGLAGAYFGVLLTKRLLGYRVKTGDVFAPAVALGMAVGRVGCFLTEQVGTATSLPWGIRVSPEAAARIPQCPACVAGVRMHPSFLYEIGFQLLMLVVLLRLRGRVPVPGELFKIYLLGYGTFRFLVEFVRGNPDYLWGMSGSQVFLLVTMPVLIGYFVRQLARHAYRAPVPVAEPVRVLQGSAR